MDNIPLSWKNLIRQIEWTKLLNICFDLKILRMVFTSRQASSGKPWIPIDSAITYTRKVLSILYSL